MIKHSLLILLYFFHINPEAYGYPSLFLPEKEEKTDSNKLSLSGIVYRDAHLWTIWINQKMISSDTISEISGFSIEQVRHDAVQFSWMPPHSSQRERFSLHPGESFLILDQIVVEET